MIRGLLHSLVVVAMMSGVALADVPPPAARQMAAHKHKARHKTRAARHHKHHAHHAKAKAP